MIKAVLFDLDGVLIDTETLYTGFWAGMGEEFSLSPTFAADIKGTTLPSILEYFPAEKREYVTGRIHDFEDTMPYNFFPGAKKLLATLREAGVRIAVVTSSDDVKMSHLQRQHPEFLSMIDYLVDSSMISKSKPDPEGYLKAAEALDVSPGECIVVEDSLQGLEAGHRAGAMVVGIATTNPRHEVEQRSNVCLDSISQFTLDILHLTDPFLDGVAKAFVENEADDLADYCFVTPNKRSGVFLRDSFARRLSEVCSTALLPEVIPVSDFIADFSSGADAPRIRQLFILYNAYKRVLQRRMSAKELAAGKHLVDFNRFRYWGDILLNDFNDVDRYMVDSSQIFRNVEALKEISANYLTTEQLEIIRRYWNEELVPEPVKEFWNHITYRGENSKADKKNVAGFVKLWQAMNDIYVEFRRDIEAEGLTYPGKAYRDAAQEVADADVFPFKKYVFVGFNVLSTSERKIFESLQKKGMADFYWDYSSPQFNVPGNRAARFLKQNIKDFPSFYKEVGRTPLPYYPVVEILSMPTTIGQAKFVPQILRELYPNYFRNGSDGENAVKREQNHDDLLNTAIVLPDENLVQPLINSIPEQIPAVNVTMGFPLRHTPVATLLSAIVSMQLRARQVKSRGTFFFEDVSAVLSHPLIRLNFTDICNNIIAEINEKKLFNIPADTLVANRYAPLKPLFELVSNTADPETVLNYYMRLLRWLRQVVTDNAVSSGNAIVVNVKAETTADEYDEDFDEELPFEDDVEMPKADTKATDENVPSAAGIPDTETQVLGPAYLDLQYIDGYIDAVEQLHSLAGTYLKDVYLEDSTVFQLVERVVGSQTVNYDGQPLVGLQVMGVLESRNLDFQNVVLTSVNERIFPRKHYTKSFIPNALRAGYGMATLEHQESMYAYYFYRMISRARRVYLIFDSRKESGRSLGPSRFIRQIRYQFPSGLVHYNVVSTPVAAPSEERITIEKTPRVMRRLNEFRTPGSGRYFSASSLNEYLTCPLSFYLTHVEGYYADNEIVDYMEDYEYGRILHEALQNMFVKARGSNSELKLTPELRQQLSRKGNVEAFVTEAIKTQYLKKPANDPAPLVGDTLIYCNIMSRTIRQMLLRENDLHGDAYFVKAEEKRKEFVKLTSKHSLNLNYTIDRIDRIEEDGESFYRLIDYKTGGDAASASSVKALFTNPNSGYRPKAIFQLMLYSNAYAACENYNGRIEPFLYLLRSVYVNPLSPLRVEKQVVADYADINAEFLDELDLLLDEIFDPAKPFKANPGNRNEHCKFCKLKKICAIPDEP